MIFACFLLLSTITILLPSCPLYLTTTHTHRSHLPISMSEMNQEIMKQLLADQARVLLSELKNHVKIEVANQMAVHSTKLAQLNDDQNLLRKQLDDLSTQIRTILPSIPMPGSTCPSPPSAAHPAPAISLTTTTPLHYGVCQTNSYFLPGHPIWY